MRTFLLCTEGKVSSQLKGKHSNVEKALEGGNILHNNQSDGLFSVLKRTLVDGKHFNTSIIQEWGHIFNYTSNI